MRDDSSYKIDNYHIIQLFCYWKKLWNPALWSSRRTPVLINKTLKTIQELNRISDSNRWYHIVFAQPAGLNNYESIQNKYRNIVTFF